MKEEKNNNNQTTVYVAARHDEEVLPVRAPVWYTANRGHTHQRAQPTAASPHPHPLHLPSIKLACGQQSSEIRKQSRSFVHQNPGLWRRIPFPAPFSCHRQSVARFKTRQRITEISGGTSKTPIARTFALLFRPRNANCIARLPRLAGNRWPTVCPVSPQDNLEGRRLHKSSSSEKA